MLACCWCICSSGEGVGSYAVQGVAYNGSLLAANLLSHQRTLVLSSFGPTQNLTITDANDKLTLGETVNIAGNNYVMIGSGTAQPGINLLGITIPTGTARDLILVQSATTGKLHFLFPDGTPNATGMIALVVNVDAIGYDLSDQGPLCFAAGTGITTPGGLVPVEQLAAGDRVLTADGRSARVLAVIAEPAAAGPSARHMAVRIAAGAYGPGLPARDLRLSQQHRVAVAGPGLDLMFGFPAALLPAAALVDFHLTMFEPPQEAPVYYHLLCDRHCLVIAEGLAAETLLWPEAERQHIPDRDRRRIERQHPEILAAAQPCLPQLSLREGRLLLRETRNLRGWEVEIGNPASFDSKGQLARRLARI